VAFYLLLRPQPKVAPALADDAASSKLEFKSIHEPLASYPQRALDRRFSRLDGPRSLA